MNQRRVEMEQDMAAHPEHPAGEEAEESQAAKLNRRMASVEQALSRVV